MSARRTVPHPVVWTILYLPFGVLGGFVGVALTFLATLHGLTVTEGSFLNGAQMVSQWLKWMWAPVVDVTLTPKRWYLIGTGASALGVLVMAMMPLSPETLWLLLVVIGVASLLNSLVGMSIEAMMAATTPPEEVGRTSAWFQAGNLGGYSLIGAGLGMLLLELLPWPWLTGVIMAGVMMSCTLALPYVPDPVSPEAHQGAGAAFVDLLRDIAALSRTKGGLLSAFLCVLPIGTGAAQGALTQAAIAAQWGAGAGTVFLVQAVLVGVLTMVGCFGGGWLCDRMHPRSAYALIGLTLAGIAVGMAVTPFNVYTYVAWNAVYALGVGLAYAAFTAVVLNAMGTKSGATKYTLYASLSNFPIWWLGLVLARIADLRGPAAMLLAEAGFAVVAIGLFLVVTRLVGRTQLPDRVDV